jgi:hypothetical protein
MAPKFKSRPELVKRECTTSKGPCKKNGRGIELTHYLVFAVVNPPYEQEGHSRGGDQDHA